jgi:selenide, water dikinase
LPPGSIAQVLSALPKEVDPNLIVGTKTHDDAGVYRISPDLALVQTVDFFPPVVNDPFAFGQIAATNALSDVYAMGGTPLTALNLLGYPDDQLSNDWMREILAGGAERCVEARCTIVGGHTIRDTEIKFGLSVTGTVHPDHVVTNANAKPNDVLILTKPLGTGFVTTAAKKATCSTDLLNAAIHSMRTLNREACDAMMRVGINAATDVTGFGLAGHGYEMASGANLTLEIELSKLPLFPGLAELGYEQFQTRAVKSNKAYTIDYTRIEGTPDPLSLTTCYDPQTSGGLLIACPPEKVDRLITELKNAGTIVAAIIGKVLPKQDVSLVFKA